ncbi:MAG: molybdopterin-dependent oxidoreductase [Actinomycetota bacterium]|nr:molybdopterin-dependent oxidoreductase [Actinomycetota bacterium]
MLGLGAVGIVGGSRIQGAIGTVLNPIQSADPTGITSLIPGGDGFRLYTVTSGFPSESAADYRLTVDGLVDRPLTLTVADLQAMAPTRLVKAFQCVTGWRVPNVHWIGVTLSDLLDRAGVQASGQALRFESFDRTYTESLTMAEARRPDVIAAYSMLGGPVSTAHGGPVRLYAAPMYGYKSCKWLSRIQVVDRVVPGYWEQVGNYDVEAWVGRSNGRDDAAT